MKPTRRSFLASAAAPALAFSPSPSRAAEAKPNLIREEKVHQLYSQMQVGQNRFGMQTMTQALVSLAQRNLISNDEALAHATEPEEVRQMLGQPRVAYSGAPRPAAG